MRDEQKPIWSEDYTCGCGIYVHPARRIGLGLGPAIHIADCPYAAPVPAIDVDEAMRLADVYALHHTRLAPVEYEKDRAALVAYLKGTR
jgi:hypothetical protein